MRLVLEPDDGLLEHGTPVEVRQRFDGKWSQGFVVERATAEGYLVRRDHDGVVLPEHFPPGDVRHVRRRRPFWRH